jgi:hypothetical protein
MNHPTISSVLHVEKGVTSKGKVLRGREKKGLGEGKMHKLTLKFRLDQGQ